MEPSNGAGAAAYAFVARSATKVRFVLNANGPDEHSNSICLQIDTGAKYRLDIKTKGRWTMQQSSSKMFDVSKGTHTLRIIGREDGTMLRSIQICAGDATFTGVCS